MSYLLIKEEDTKVFKSFLSGNEIKVGIFANPKNEVFDKGNEIEIFYGNENTDTYRAAIKQTEVASPMANKSGRSLLMLSLVKI
jgi:hypothetical protein